MLGLDIRSADILAGGSAGVGGSICDGFVVGADGSIVESLSVRRRLLLNGAGV